MKSKKAKKAPYLFTSEAVSVGHPDKMADQISDAILDAVLAQDPAARVAAETLLAGSKVVLAGEITTTAVVDYAQVARDTIRSIGYTAAWGYDPDTVNVDVLYGVQSPDIAQGVDRGSCLDQGAGDQGLMFGFATIESSTRHGLAYAMAQALMVKQHEEHDHPFPNEQILGPDAKAQVTIRYENDRPHSVHTIVLSTQHHDYATEMVEKRVLDTIINPVLAAFAADLEDTSVRPRILINPTGKFVVGGPVGDSGLTGRKIIVDTYGGYCPHGGGAFSGKDPSKVDRSAAYMARHIACAIIATGFARSAQVQLSYAIGVAQPISVNVVAKGIGPLGGKRPNSEWVRAVQTAFDLSPFGIEQFLDLRDPDRGFKYEWSARNGHFYPGLSSWDSHVLITQSANALLVALD